jgi:hypothetical protein
VGRSVGNKVALPRDQEIQRYGATWRIPKATRLRRRIAGLTCTVRWVIARMNELLVGYARVPREQQDLTSQRNGLHALASVRIGSTSVTV